MCVDKPNAQAVQPSSFNRKPHLAQLCYAHLRQRIEQRQRRRALPQRPQRQLRHNEGMDHNIPLVEMLTHFFISEAEVVDPDRRIGENQICRARWRGIFFNPGIVPPREASRRALTRSMRALRASRISAVFSVTPVNSWAMRTRSSSSARVVLIKIPSMNYGIILCHISVPHYDGGNPFHSLSAPCRIMIRSQKNT